MATYTKKDAIRVVTECARSYESELVNRDLLIVCSDKHKHISCIELSFYKRNYLHLTGLRMRQGDDNEKISADDFYDRCLSGKLSEKDFEFAKDGTTLMKLQVLPYVMKKNLSANMIGDYNSSKPMLYTEKLAGSIKACIGFVHDQVTGRLVPNTMLKEDIRKRVRESQRVVAIFRKRHAVELYQEITYLASKTEVAQIEFPSEYEYLKNIEVLE